MMGGANMQGDDIIKIIENEQNTMSKGHKAIASYIINHYECNIGLSNYLIINF